MRICIALSLDPDTLHALTECLAGDKDACERLAGAGARLCDRSTLTEEDCRILELAEKGTTVSEAAIATGLSNATAYTILEKLTAIGLIEKHKAEKKGPGKRPHIYKTTEKGNKIIKVCRKLLAKK